MNKTVKCLLGILIGLISGAALYYLWLPPLNAQSPAFWGFILVVLILTGLTAGIGSSAVRGDGLVANVRKVILALCGAVLLVLLVGSLISSQMLRAGKYASLIDVEDAVFEEDMPESTSVTNIALMDTASATILGNRTLGQLSSVVSQFEVSTIYTQINYQGAPEKVANLEYAGFLKWWNNRKTGIPGYVMVDPVGNTADYVKLDTPLKYVRSAYFGEDLERALRFRYPTKIFGAIYFEIDEEGNPWYIVSCLRPNAGLFGAKDVAEVIIFNPCDGSSEIYDVDETPAWIDIAYTGDLACEKYNWYGTLSGGWLNSVFGNKDCKKTTSDFGYIMLGDDVWYFTGVTSVMSDESNIGFILSNARTGEYKYYSVVGAEEYSAMAAAEGEVQEKGYVASFPSLINVYGEATYILVLKDSGGLVKLFALVNVENYGYVATGTTQGDAFTAYRSLLERVGVITFGNTTDSEPAAVTVADVRIVSMDEMAVVYITGEDGEVYKGALESDESLILIRPGDVITVSAASTEVDGISAILSWSFQ